jgi:hypothetical protein
LQAVSPKSPSFVPLRLTMERNVDLSLVTSARPRPAVQWHGRSASKSPSLVGPDCFDDLLLMPVKYFLHEELLCVKNQTICKQVYKPVQDSNYSSKRPSCGWSDIVRMEHLNGYHCDSGILISRLRNRFFIIHARRTVKRVLKDCAGFIMLRNFLLLKVIDRHAKWLYREPLIPQGLIWPDPCSVKMELNAG